MVIPSFFNSLLYRILYVVEVTTKHDTYRYRYYVCIVFCSLRTRLSPLFRARTRIISRQKLVIEKLPISNSKNLKMLDDLRDNGATLVSAFGTGTGRIQRILRSPTSCCHTCFEAKGCRCRASKGGSFFSGRILYFFQE